jgi:phosphoribosyl 1,2-cyclic phosphodiesterase
VSLHFQSLRSSSAGNCLALWTATSSILIDCGVQVQREYRELLDEHVKRARSLDAVIVSHAHGDHAAYGSLRVLAREGIPVHAHARVLRQLRERHRPEDWKEAPRLRPFAGEPFDVGDFHVTPIEVPHAPGFPTFGFALTAGRGRASRTIVVCTDFNDYASMLPHIVDADFVFVEANHDLNLLRKHPNPASAFHLNNVKAAWLLCHAVRQSAAPPRAILLGHLSEERNTRRLAMDEVRRVFARQGVAAAFDLDAAPAHKPSAIVEV